MSRESCYSAVEKLLNHLDRNNLRKHLQLSDEDIADTLWLALQMGVVETKSTEEKEDSGLDSIESITISTSQEDHEGIEFDSTLEESSLSESDSSANLYTEDSFPPDSEQEEEKTETEGLPFPTPAAPALPNKLQINKALRPLMRKVPSLTRKILDAEATVTRIAEQDIWLPVTKPEPERWLSLELIVEENRSSFIWQETIDELEKLLHNHGAFRSMRTWNLSNPENESSHLSDSATSDLPPRKKFSSSSLPENKQQNWKGITPKLTRRKKGTQRSKTQHNYRELIHTNGRGLIIIVTDCVSPLWQQETIYDWLEKWSSKSPTAILQLFPERLWLSTELGLGEKVKLSAFKPGVPNSQLVCEEDLAIEKALNLPIITLEAETLNLWSKVMVGRGQTQTPAIVLDRKFVKQQLKKYPTVKPSDFSPERLVDIFLATASSSAQRLAGLMAAAPVSLPVVHLIQKTFFPRPNQSTPVNVAEVFLSGMIKRVNSSKDGDIYQYDYDFVPGVRKLLNQGVRLPETEKVLDVVSEYIAENLRLSIKSFTALLLRHQEFSQEEQAQILPFAQVTLEVLRNLGGEYAEFADEIKIKPVSPPEVDIEVSTEEESDKLLKLETEIVTVATIEFEFEFDLVTIVRREQVTNPLNRFIQAIRNAVYSLEASGWTYQRHRGKASYFREQLSVNDEQLDNSQLTSEEGNSNQELIPLDMVYIPGGTFLMGTEDEEIQRLTEKFGDYFKYESPQHEVTVPPFYMSKYPITQRQWKTVWEADLSAIALRTDLKMNEDLESLPSYHKDNPQSFSYPSTRGNLDLPYYGDNPSYLDRPVEQVTWYQAKEYCDRLSLLTGREYRLPTEAEWEYACRANNSPLDKGGKGGSAQPFYFGETITSDLANYNGENLYADEPKGVRRRETTPVGMFPPNAFGLYDMHGNVWEWCEDDWRENYNGAPKDGSAWLSEESKYKVLRGGSFGLNPNLCRSAYRYFFNARDIFNNIGFRVVCVLPRTY